MLTGARFSTVATRPDLLEPSWLATQDAFPEYNNHGDVTDKYWPRLVDERAEFQFQLTGEGDEILARCRSIPIRWDGSLADLPGGLDAALERGFEVDGADVLCALLVSVPPGLRGQGVSAVALGAMRRLACEHGLAGVIAPVRPRWKERYPLVPIERYVTWRRADGLLFDPWMRVHERLGARLLRAEPDSLRITGSVADWETWTQMAFPESGAFWFPGGLAPVTIDLEGDRGSYSEPNVWMHHSL